MPPTLNELLKTMVEQGASDLHLTTNSPPQIRHDGRLKPLNYPPLTPSETKQINAEHYLAGGVSFGPFTSDNITPDADGKPAGLSLGEFKTLLRTGHDPDDPDEILQVMPWPVFGDMTDRDLNAIYEYLRSIPHAEPGT